MTEIWLLVIVAWVALVSGILSAAVADSKGRSAFGWFVVGLLTGALGLLAAVGMSAQERVAAEGGGDTLGRALTIVAISMLVFVVVAVVWGLV